MWCDIIHSLFFLPPQINLDWKLEERRDAPLVFCTLDYASTTISSLTMESNEEHGAGHWPPRFITRIVFYSDIFSREVARPRGCEATYIEPLIAGCLTSLNARLLPSCHPLLVIDLNFHEMGSNWQICPVFWQVIIYSFYWVFRGVKLRARCWGDEASSVTPGQSGGARLLFFWVMLFYKIMWREVFLLINSSMYTVSLEDSSVTSAMACCSERFEEWKLINS